ncbi:hypothetical protein ANN_09920 [Periplaneta americana]|uniref:Uncharacterized protein n=1 Tax=Periplaneta americana TaxID=6978 RepID=A0ABQ8TML5_PERAM|nr:hypothetical protein ANN_09920 [Periplaneta americana]
MQRCHIAQLHDGLKRSGKTLLHRYQREGNDFLERIVAMDETWTRSYEPNLKRQSNEWKHPGSPRPKKVRPTQSAVKVMFIVAYDIDGVILHHAVPPRQTTRTTGTSTVLTRYDPCDYDLFTKVKEPLRGTRYNTRYEFIRALGQSYGTSTKMDALMVYDAFQTFGKSVYNRRRCASGDDRRKQNRSLNANDYRQEVVSLSAYIAVNFHLFCCHSSIQYFYMAFSKYRLLNMYAAMCDLNLLQNQPPAIYVASNALRWRSSL